MSASGPPDGDHATLPPHARSTLAARPDAAAGTMTRSLGGDEDAQPPAAAHVDFGTDRYEDLGLIGRGGQGEVRRVRDHKMNRVLALKLLRTAASTAARQRFLVETAITVGLQHPGIVPVYDRGVTPDGRPWYTMKEVEGRDFGDAIAEAHAGGDDAWTLRQLVDTFLRVCEAVAYAHEQGVVHRDLKPQNVMIGRFGEVLVMDWGLARRAGAPADPDDGVSPPTPQATALGAVMGTPAYMAPEQASGDTAAIGPATDVYALGVMLHEVLTGRRPATGGFEQIRAARLAADGPVPAVGPAPLRALCARATRRDPAERPPDAGAMAREVGRWLAGARQREQAGALVAQAQAIEPEVDTLRAEAARARARGGGAARRAAAARAGRRQAPGLAARRRGAGAAARGAARRGAAAADPAIGAGARPRVERGAAGAHRALSGAAPRGRGGARPRRRGGVRGAARRPRSGGQRRVARRRGAADAAHRSARGAGRALPLRRGRSAARRGAGREPGRDAGQRRAAGDGELRRGDLGAGAGAGALPGVDRAAGALGWHRAGDRRAACRHAATARCHRRR
ncbi:MAG: serine/threonine protein kinase [Myxococcales bacterium]|nr:serine/threonine protein kinase [Myxococcales bacterium]